jgi:hypothetical protein
MGMFILFVIGWLYYATTTFSEPKDNVKYMNHRSFAVAMSSVRLIGRKQ